MRSFRLPWLFASLLAASDAPAAKVYYVNQPEGFAGEVRAVNPDGTEPTLLYTAQPVAPLSTDMRGIAVDATAGKLFFAYSDYETLTSSTGNRTAIKLLRMPVAGGTPEPIITFADNNGVSDVEWDGEWIYYSQLGPNQLRRVKPDGTGDSLVLTHVPAGPELAFQGPYFFGLDLVNRQAYWGVVSNSGDTNTRYSRGSLDTGAVDPTFSITSPTRTRDIAVDAGNQTVFWMDRQDGNLYRRAMSGGTITPVFPYRTFNAPHGLALDLEAGKAYIADTGKRGNASEASSHRVVRVNLDGSGVVEFLSPVSSLAEPWDVTVDLTSASYADWKRRFFASTAALAGPRDDFDGDGVPNGAEYAFCTRPHVRGDEPQLTAVPGGARYAARRQADIPLSVEISSDLVAWRANGGPDGEVTQESSRTSRDEDTEWITVVPTGVAAGNGRIYFRLRAVLP